METIQGFPVCTIHYGKSGKANDSDHAKTLQKFVKDEALEELLVLSHGWNNSESEARRLYDGLLKHLRASLPLTPALEARKIGVMAVIWPSKRFKAFEQEDGGGHLGGAASVEPQIGDPME